MKNPVAGLMPVRNTPDAWLWTALKGAATQSYPDFYLSVCDNGSTVSTTIETLKEAVETWPDRVRLTKEERPGTAYALDAALKLVDEATYLTKFDSDDIFHADREKNRVKLFETLPPQVAIVYDNFFQLNYEPLPNLQPIILRPYDYRLYLEQSYIHGNSMWRASVYDKIPKSFVYEDYEGKANRHGEDLNHWLAITDYWDAFWYDADPSYTWTYRSYPKSKYHSDRKGVDYARSMLQHRAKERMGLL